MSAVAVLDLDGFKAFNDAHGHQAGDRRLVQTAQLLRTGVRSAVLARMGGDEFLVIGTGTSRAEVDESRRLMRRGASAFGVQQAGLIGLLLHDGARPRPVPSAIAATTLAGLAVLDTDGGAPDPVLTGYGLLLGSMSALAMGDGERPRNGRAVALGGALFLVSDAAIIVGQHYAKTPRAQAISSVVILSTYTAALGLLVHGLRDEG